MADSSPGFVVRKGVKLKFKGFGFTQTPLIQKANALRKKGHPSTVVAHGRGAGRVYVLYSGPKK